MDKIDLTERTAKKQSRLDVHRSEIISQLQMNIAEISNWTEQEFLELDRTLEDISYEGYEDRALKRLLKGLKPLFSCQMCQDLTACEDDVVHEICMKRWSEYANEEIAD